LAYTLLDFNSVLFVVAAFLAQGLALSAAFLCVFGAVMSMVVLSLHSRALTP